MILKRSKDYYLEIISQVIACSFATVILCKFNFPVVILILIVVPMYLFSISTLISVGRTFILDETGCTVSFWKFKRTYTWDQIKTKVIITYSFRPLLMGTNCPEYLTEIIFTPYIMRKPRFIRAYIYSIFHPFRCIYMYFDPKENRFRSSKYYEADEEEFRTKMAQWGVELIEKRGQL